MFANEITMYVFARRVVLAVALLCAGIWSTSGVAATIQIPNGDSAALRAAIAQAGQSEKPTVIRLARNGTYPLSASTGEPIELAGHVVLDGNGATITAGEADVGLASFKVPRGATYRILDLAWEGRFVSHGAWLRNRGSLTMDNVSLSGLLVPHRYNCGGTFCTFPISSYSGSLLVSGNGPASLRLDNVTFDLVQAVAGDPKYADASAEVAGTVVSIAYSDATFRHVTLSLTMAHPSAADTKTSAIGLQVTGLRHSDDGTRVAVSNSIVDVATTEAAGLRVTACASTREAYLNSLGGNIANPQGNCGFQKVVDDLAFGQYGDHGGPVPTLALELSSPAIGFGAPDHCLAADARGYVRGPACDSGAFEYGAQPRHDLAADRLGGYWSAPDKAAWLAVSYPMPNTALLVWSTFDAEGHAATVYGVGHFVDDNIVVTQAAIDRPVPGTDPVVLKPELWGHLRLDIQSKFDAVLHYESIQPGFDDGSRNLERLTISRGRRLP